MKKLFAISLISSIFGLTLIYFSAISIRPIKIELNEINFDLIGKSVRTSGFIIDSYYSRKGNLFLLISDKNNRTKIQVPLFSNFLKYLNYSVRDFKIGRKILVSGTVSEYRGILQIIPRKIKDVMLEWLKSFSVWLEFL